MSSNFQFRVRSPMASRPFYFTLIKEQDEKSKKSKNHPKVSWSVIPGKEIIDVLDEQDYFSYDFTVPQPSEESKNLPLRAFSSSRRFSPAVSQVQINEKNQSGKQILQITPKLSHTFLSLPYLPSDIFFHMNFAEIVDRINEFTIKKDKKTKMPISGIMPRDSKITPPVYFSKISSSQAQPCNNIFKAIKKFLSSEDISAIIQIIHILDGDTNNLVPECAFQLLIFTNSLEPNEMTIRAWKLMMVLIGRYNNAIKDIEKDILKGYFIGIAGDEQNSINKDIKVYAKICLVRLLCTENLQIPPEQPTQQEIPLDEYIQKSMNLTQLVGVSLSEIFIKEEYKGIRSENYYNDNSNDHGFGKKASESKQLLVPIILQKFIYRLIELDVHNQVGAFRLSGCASDQIAGFHRINNGDWEPPDSNNFATFTSMLKSFTRRIQDALIPRSLFLETWDKKNTADQIIERLNHLPNATRDTLLFITGFFQLIAKNADHNKMTPKNIALSLGPSITRDPENMSDPIVMKNYPEECNKRNHFIQTMIDYWNTSTVYPFSK